MSWTMRNAATGCFPRAAGATARRWSWRCGLAWSNGRGLTRSSDVNVAPEMARFLRDGVCRRWPGRRFELPKTFPALLTRAPKSRSSLSNPEMTQDLGLQLRRQTMETCLCLKQAQLTFSIVDTP
jgi:hypothetical protein